ncbi:phage morphogeneis protein [Gallibacterium salpingitidis]|uniref:Phage morphogeneis protein n=1 Tax=Gallibacterium salpingitidis TaxID=505341 RepID=A0AB36E1S5_9PAST|nr:phage virion morphogenesis protein [Gallibacterium salpingitidis]OBX06611.1 phage morphogeneis protein [Gallibacterium salpingitidis]OBX08344.1 phage morphogeneis protein [Gallibacterium salpingitidis]
MIKITLEDNASDKLAKIAIQLQHPKKLYGVLGETLKKIHKKRFEQEVDPEGKKWKALDDSTLTQKQKKNKSLKILRQDGYLSDKTAYNYDDNSLEFGSDAKYARIHQFGGKTGRGHKTTLSARPWLGVNKDDEAALLNKATALLQKQLAQSIK